jgi:hypothetical protein
MRTIGAGVWCGVWVAMAGAAVAQDAAPVAAPRPTYRVERAAEPVKVDGMLDDGAWQRRATFELAYETFPGENVPPQVRTEGWIAYDTQNVYVAFRAHDPEPATIRARLTDRDRAFQDDFVGVVFDTFNDERRAFEFFVNPLGVQMDLMQAEITGSEDDTWDTLWASAGRLTDEGFNVEMAIPFSSLRFPHSDGEQTWGLDALRIRPREQRRRIGLNPLPRGSNCYLCHESKLTGFAGVSPGRNLEFAPTLVADQASTRADFPNGSLENDDPEAEVGMTARWGITPNLTLNAAINPDFSQVEADAAQLQVNTQFALFFPEKRPFFLEGADLFQTRFETVYSRTIADPKWGLKLTGKEGKSAFGLILAQDRITNFLLPSSQGSDLASLDEENVSAMGRYRRDFLKASSYGFQVTGREGSDSDYASGTVGADVLFRWGDIHAFRIEGFASQTEYPESIVADFGQPDGTIDDHALRVVYQRSGRIWFGYGLVLDVGKDFRADLGFIPQVDYRRYNGLLERNVYFDGKPWHRVTLGTEIIEDREQDGDPLASSARFYGFVQGPREAWIRLRATAGDRTFAGRTFDEDSWDLFAESRLTKTIYAYVDSRFGGRVDFANARQGDETYLAPGIRLDVGRGLRLTLDHAYTRLSVEPDDAELFTANVANFRASYQFNVRTFVRLITQVVDVERSASRYTVAVDPHTEDVFNQLLFSYKLNPQTVLFLGYSDNYSADGREVQDLTQENRTLFFKVGYAFVL